MSNLCQSISEAYKSLRELGPALIYQQQCMRILENDAQTESLIYASALHAVGVIHFDLKENAKSLEYFQSALSLKKRLAGEGSLSQVITLQFIQNIYARMSRFQDAIGVEKEILDLK